jgi:ketosteroid isomerase-like protein
MIRFLFLLCCLPAALLAQSPEEREAVRAPIQQLFDGMRAADSSMVRQAFHPDAHLLTIREQADGQAVLETESLAQFLQAVARPREQVLDERIWSYDIRIDGPLATAWTEYSFFLGAQLSHCGVNAFQLLHTPQGWKIFQVTDTRRREGCQAAAPDEAAAIHALLDDWHRAAARADADAFFGAMTADGIYLGTDASERWLRDELRSWAKAAFERESAWAFSPAQRQLYFAPNGQAAWFEELLDTWMGPCRGSGVLAKTPDGWRIQHYNLAALVPNDKMRDYLELLKE